MNSNLSNEQGTSSFNLPSPWNQQFAPESGWLEDDSFPFGAFRHIFRAFWLVLGRVTFQGRFFEGPVRIFCKSVTSKYHKNGACLVARTVPTFENRTLTWGFYFRWFLYFYFVAMGFITIQSHSAFFLGSFDLFPTTKECQIYRIKLIIKE